MSVLNSKVSNFILYHLVLIICWKNIKKFYLKNVKNAYFNYGIKCVGYVGLDTITTTLILIFVPLLLQSDT